MAKLKDFALYPIAWNLTPEDAVTLIWNGATTTGMPNIRPCAQKATWQYILWWTAGKSARFAACAPQFRKRGGSVSMPLEGDLLGRLAQGQRGLAGVARHAQNKGMAEKRTGAGRIQLITSAGPAICFMSHPGYLFAAA